jgi:hypothetical protein
MSRTKTATAATVAFLIIGTGAATAAPEEGGGAGCVDRTVDELSSGERVIVDAFESVAATRKALAFVGVDDRGDTSILVEIAEDILCG